MNIKRKPRETPRRRATTTNSAFTRNSVVISRSQRELAAHKQSVSQRQIDQKKQVASKVFKRRMVLVAVFILLGVSLYRMQVTGVSVRSAAGPAVSDEVAAQYGRTLHTLIASRTPLRQSWLINSKQIEENFIHANPEVKSIAFNSRQPFSSVMHAELTFRRPVFVWRGVGESHFVDSEGVLFAQNRISGMSTARLPSVTDQAGSAQVLGNTVVTGGVLRDIALLYRTLPDVYGKDHKITEVTLPRAARELQVKLDGIPYYIKFSTDRPITSQIGEVGTLSTHFKASNITPAEYIDVRVEHKAFYK